MDTISPIIDNWRFFHLDMDHLISTIKRKDKTIDDIKSVIVYYNDFSVKTFEKSNLEFNEILNAVEELVANSRYSLEIDKDGELYTEPLVNWNSTYDTMSINVPNSDIVKETSYELRF